MVRADGRQGEGRLWIPSHVTKKSKGLYLKVSSRLATSTAHRLTAHSPHLCKAAAGRTDDVALHHEPTSTSPVCQGSKTTANTDDDASNCMAHGKSFKFLVLLLQLIHQHMAFCSVLPYHLICIKIKNVIWWYLFCHGYCLLSGCYLYYGELGWPGVSTSRSYSHSHLHPE